MPEGPSRVRFSAFGLGTHGARASCVRALAVLSVAAAVAGPRPTQAQAPYIVGTWKLNIAASRVPGPPPQVHVRRYSLAPDGTLIGLAVVVDPAGNPYFLQFAAKADGKDYAEFDSRSLAALQIDGTAPKSTYAETAIDSHTVEWVDKLDGKVTAHGRKWVSADGKTLSFTAEATNAGGEAQTFLFVFDRQDVGPPR